MFYVKKYYRKALMIGIPIIVLLLICIFIYIKTSKNEKVENDLLFNDEISVSKKEDFEVSKIDNSQKVNIKGAVVNPGVYEFTKGERVIDIINKSGGLLENADTSVINLSKNLFDEMVIVIYTYDEINAMKEKNVIIQYVEKECNCPSIKNDACITEDKVNSTDKNIEEIKNENNNSTVDKNTNQTEDKNVEGENNKKISINKATSEELQTLSGIGKSKADAIVSYREENGNFKSIEDIMNVSGIGESVFAKIKNDITI